MQTFPINYVAVLVASLIKGLIGWLWFSPLAFLRQWQAETGITQDQMKRTIGRGMAVTLIGNFLMAWVLLHAIHYAGAVGAGQAAAVAFFNWLGFVLVILLFTWAAEQRSGKLTALNAANELLGMIVMGIILNSWT